MIYWSSLDYFHILIKSYYDTKNIKIVGKNGRVLKEYFAFYILTPPNPVK